MALAQVYFKLFRLCQAIMTLMLLGLVIQLLSAPNCTMHLHTAFMARTHHERVDAGKAL